MSDTTASAKELVDLTYQIESRASYFWRLSLTINTTIIILLAGVLLASDALPATGFALKSLIVAVHLLAYSISLMALLMEQLRYRAFVKAIGERLESGAIPVLDNPPAALLRHMVDRSRKKPWSYLRSVQLAFAVHFVYLGLIWALILLV
jgi:hypothetical protein